jgi:hypothetical protein
MRLGRCTNIGPKIGLFVRFNSNIPRFIKDGSDAAIESLNRSKIVGDLKELYSEMERRKYNTRWIVGSVVVIGGCIFYGAITDWATDQAADVTAKYLENPKFKKDVTAFAEQTINELVRSPKVQADIADLLGDTVKKLADTPEIQEKLADLFVKVFRSEAIRNAGGELSEEVVDQLLNSPKYEDIRNDAIRFAIQEMINIVNNNELQQAAGLASWNIFKVFIGVSSADNKKIIVTDKT